MATVEFRGIYKSFGAVEVIKDFNLVIAEAEFIVLVGPSGCGKSTVLRMLAGLEEITSGDILINGKRVNQVEPKKRDIAMVFQNYALYPHMTVAENIAFGLKLRHRPKTEIGEKVKEVAELLELKDYLQRKPKELSGGQKQRVAMGRAIARDPAVFLFDEPLSSLDAELRVQLRKEIARLHHKLKTTTIYVTHDQIEALTLAQRLVVMNGGVVQQVGTPEEVYNNPNNTFVAGFIGHPKMNFLAVEPHLAGKEAYLCGDSFRLSVAPEVIQKLPQHKVLLGVRPEHLQPISSSTKSALFFNGKIELKEPVGNETLITTELAPFRQMTFRVNGSCPHQVGEEVKLGAGREQLLFFDHLTGARLKI